MENVAEIVKIDSIPEFGAKSRAVRQKKAPQECPAAEGGKGPRGCVFSCFFQIESPKIMEHVSILKIFPIFDWLIV